MSKKLIAVASAAALALTALVAVPAQADLGDITVSLGVNNTNVATSAATAMTVGVPEENKIPGVGTTTALLFAVEPAVSGGNVSATSSGGVKLLTEAQYNPAAGVDDATTATGTQSFSQNAVAEGAVNIYAYNTSTTAGTIKITVGDSIRTYWIKGIAGTPNTITATFPTALNSSTAGDIDVTVRDVFGNAITGASGTTLFNTALAPSTLTTNVVGAADVVAPDRYTWNTTRKVWAGKVIGVEGGGQASVTVTLDNGGFDGADNGLAAASRVAFSTVSSADLATQIKNLTAQVAALQATVAKRVTKKRYNTLARKWNAANPSAKVALKK
jgi:hypothetical protein